MFAVWYILSMGAQGFLFSLGTTLEWEPSTLWVTLLIIWHAVGFIAAPIVCAIENLRTSRQHGTLTFRHKFTALVIATSPMIFVFILSVWVLASGFWEGYVWEWALFLAATASVPTWFMAPITSARLLGRIRSQWRIIMLVPLAAVGITGVGGWIWGATIDDRVEDYFGKGSVLSEIARDSVRAPAYDDPFFFQQGFGAWRIMSIEDKGKGHCMRVQFYGWMRTPVRGWGSKQTVCLGLVLNDATFIPNRPYDSMRQQDKVFLARGTLDSWTEIQGLIWQDGALTLTLSPYSPLTDLVLEFIDDGDVILTLLPSDATTDSEAGTLTWAVEDQPWRTGDILLTFRIRVQPLPATPAPAP